MRVAVRVLCAIAALALAALAAIAAIELVLAAFGRPPWLVDWPGGQEFARTSTWDDGAVRAWAVGATLLGLALLALAWWPRRPTVVPMAPPGEATSFEHVHLGVRRRSIGGALGRDLEDVPDVQVERASMQRHRLTVSAATAGDRRQADQQVKDKVQMFERRLGLDLGDPAVSVHRRPGRRVA